MEKTQPKRHQVKKITTAEMEIALAHHLNSRVNLIVPNISWGMFMHECDLLIITPSGYAWEVEIKVNKQDMLRDKKKRHHHNSGIIKHLYFAIPHYLLEHKDLIPERAGIITVERAEKDYKYADYLPLKLRCKKERKAQINSLYKFTKEQRYKVARLGAMRIWGLKYKLISLLRSGDERRMRGGELNAHSL